MTESRVALRMVDGDRSAFMPLLLEADEVESVVRTYLNDGELCELLASGPRTQATLSCAKLDSTQCAGSVASLLHGAEPARWADPAVPLRKEMKGARCSTLKAPTDQTRVSSVERSLSGRTGERIRGVDDARPTRTNPCGFDSAGDDRS